MKSAQHQYLMNSKKFPLLRGQQGGVLIEFALISLVFYVLVALVVDIGRMIFTAQVLQDAARVTARELALIPLPPNATFADALAEGTVFNPSELVIDLDSFETDADFQDHLDGLPILNKMLRPLMIFEQVEVKGTTRNLLRYPGALLDADDVTDPDRLTVAIPRVSRVSGVEEIFWVDVVEEITNGSFSVAAGLPQGGMVAVRINYPFQAAILSGFQEAPGGPFEPNLDEEFRIQANDGAVVQLNAPSTGTVLGGDELDAEAVGTYAGPYGLGRQLAFKQTLRPFRKLLSAQAIFRREVFN